MLIRSQEKTRIFNFDNVVGAFAFDREIRLAVDNNTMMIGTYSTEEKAIKVLDMIQKAYCVMKGSDCLMNGSVDNLTCVSQEVKENIVNSVREVYVFQMPQDEEVQ